MPINNQSLNIDLYNLLLTRGYDPIPKDSDPNNADKTVPPQEAEVFEFTFKQQDKKIDKAWVTLDKAQNLKLYYDDDIESKASDKSPNMDFDDSWYGFLNFLKKWAFSKQLEFELEPKEKLDNDMAQRTYIKKKESISEGYHRLGKAASYCDNIPTIKIVIQHTRDMNDDEQRFRNIKKIFLENSEGERILAPTNKPGIAHVFARHLAEGGVPNDDRWKHIKELCEEYSKMAGFKRAVKVNNFSESAHQLIEAGINHYSFIRETLSKLRTHRGYNRYFENYTHASTTDDDAQSDMYQFNELFVREKIDPRIERALPVLRKLKENNMKEIRCFEEWADNIVAESLGEVNASEYDQTLDESLSDFIDTAKKKLIALKDKLATEGGETKEMMDIYKLALQQKATPEQIQFANNQFKDVLKMLGLGAFTALPIPGGALLIFALEKLLNKKGMSILPSAFQPSQSQPATSTDQGVAEGLVDDSINSGYSLKLIDREKKLHKGGYDPDSGRSWPDEYEIQIKYAIVKNETNEVVGEATWNNTGDYPHFRHLLKVDMRDGVFRLKKQIDTRNFYYGKPTQKGINMAFSKLLSTKKQDVAEGSDQRITVGSKVYHSLHGSGKVIRRSTGAGADHWAEVKFVSGDTRRVKPEQLKLEKEQGVAEGIRDDAMAGLQRTVDFAKQHGYKIYRSPTGRKMRFVNPQLNHEIRAQVDNDGDTINVNFMDYTSGTSGNDDASYFDQVFKQAYEQALNDHQYQSALDDEDDGPYTLSQLKMLQKKGVAEADKHSLIGKIQRGHELKKKVDSSWKDIGDAQKAGDKAAGSRAFRKHERYANLERPGTWTKVDEQGVAEGYSLKKTHVEKYVEPGDPDEYTQDIEVKDTDYEIINNRTGQVVGTASWTTNDYFGPGALKIVMNNGATRYIDIWEREQGNPQTAFNRFVKDPKTAKKYKEQGVAEGASVGLKAWKKEMIERGAVEFWLDKHHNRYVAYDKDGKVISGFVREGVAEGQENTNVQDAIVNTVERLFRKNEINDYSALEAIRQGVRHHFTKPGATTESAIEGILNILDKRMRKSGNYDLSRFKEALRQGVAHQLKKQGLAEGSKVKTAKGSNARNLTESKIHESQRELDSILRLSNLK